MSGSVFFRTRYWRITRLEVFECRVGIRDILEPRDKRPKKPLWKIRLEDHRRHGRYWRYRNTVAMNRINFDRRVYRINLY
jgi:hypothetical protein